MITLAAQPSMRGKRQRGICWFLCGVFVSVLYRLIVILCSKRVSCCLCKCAVILCCYCLIPILIEFQSTESTKHNLNDGTLPAFPMIIALNNMNSNYSHFVHWIYVLSVFVKCRNLCAHSAMSNTSKIDHNKLKYFIDLEKKEYINVRSWIACIIKPIKVYEDSASALTRTHAYAY